MPASPSRLPKLLEGGHLTLSAHRDESSAWAAFRSALHDELGDSQYAVWIEPLTLHALTDRSLVLSGPEPVVRWLRKRYGRVLDRGARRVLGEGAAVSFAGDPAGDAAGAPTPGAPSPPASREDGLPGAGLNPRYTFDQFIIGDSNQLAHGAALAVAELPGQAYNPLFLHAPPGLGKTHLLHAIGNYVLAYGGGARVRLATIEAFTNHFLAALATRGQEGFKRAYRDVDVLLIDDVQFLASKAKTEEEFFHTFNALYENGRQLVLTCDRLPTQLEGLSERLRERFAAGLVADLQPPNLATRVAILRKRAALDGVPAVDEGVLEAIASRVTDNVRALEGALIRVVAYHSLTGQAIDRPLAEHVLDSMQYPQADRVAGSERSPGRASGRGPGIEAIKQEVAAHYGLSVEELVSASRAARIAWPRQLAMHLARELTGASLSSIGSAFGGRNHATILHACRRVAERASSDQQAAVDIDELSRALRRDSVDRTH